LFDEKIKLTERYWFCLWMVSILCSVWLFNNSINWDDRYISTGHRIN